MSDEAVYALKSAALSFADAVSHPGGCIQEWNAHCAAASALLIAAALEITEHEPPN